MGLRFNSLPNLALRAPPRGVRFSGTFGLLRAFIFVLLGKVFAAIPGCLFSFSTWVRCGRLINGHGGLHGASSSLSASPS